MYSALPYLASILIVLIATPFTIHVAHWIKALRINTTPEGVSRSIPTLGGLALAIGTVGASLPVLIMYTPHAMSEQWVEFTVVLSGAVGLLVLGMINDVRRLPVWVKLLGILIAALVLCAFGIRLESMTFSGWGTWELGLASWPITILWIISVIVAIKFVDGLDGLAAGVSAMACFSIGIYNMLVSHQVMVQVLMLALLGSLCGYLFFNFHPARMLSGESGVLWLGYLVGATSIWSVSTTGDFAAMGLPAAALGLPLLDSIFTFLCGGPFRRVSILAGGRGYIHRRLLELGLHHRNAVLLLYAITAGATLLGMFLLITRGVSTFMVALGILLSLILLFQALRAGIRPQSITAGDIRYDRADIGGVMFDFVLKYQVVAILDAWQSAHRRGYVAVTNPVSVVTCRHDIDMRRATEGADLRLPDGIGVVLAALMVGYGRKHRVTGPALMLDVCDRGRAFGWRHYFVGGAKGVAEHLVERLTERFEGLKVAGVYSPPFRPETDPEVDSLIDAINAARPDIVWIGLGAPKQEKWMATHRDRLNATALIAVGAAFDFHSRNVKWAPKWVRMFGMEWAYRLLHEPRRLFRRDLALISFMVLSIWDCCRSVLSGGGTIEPASTPELPLPPKPAVPRPTEPITSKT